ncbi:heavy metal-associated isoprenylated plant protein 1 [Lactuca sativa]|uniref:heavy metal-associated isoprenylated plant protein 1 n=1 Tax=Lactuca sativa TaxID=4236 RepID=UPI000CD9AFE2|nr:heavy metal-associated isoprenylated plant protein 1 [Lactuca sativa]XP_023757230.1 heavy metal-associated isoprenylated plant protein 1 [Lactuca sativa]
MATSATTSDVQVIPFHNCKGCIDKMKKAFRKLNGVELIEMDPEIGIFTISTLENLEGIRAALQKKFRKKSFIVLPGPLPPLPPPTTEPSAPPMPITPEEDYYVIGYPIDSTTTEEDYYVIGYPVDP